VSSIKRIKTGLEVKNGCFELGFYGKELTELVILDRLGGA